MAEKIVCTRCGKKRVPAPTDSDYCLKCFNGIGDRIMERTRAAVAMSNSTEFRNNDKFKMAGFLAIFHPELTRAEVLELTRDL